MQRSNNWQKLWALLLMFFVSSAGLAEDWLYTMKPGDTVWDISHKLLKDWRYWDDVLRHNNIDNATRIRPGTKIAIPLYIVREELSEVRVDKVSGAVEVIFGDNERRLPLKPGMSLAAGDRVITGENSTALFYLEDESSILLQEQSELEFTRLKTLGGGSTRSMDAKLDIRRGRMNMDANPRHAPDSAFEITTVSANSAIRGTSFRIGIEQDSARTEVLNGLVSVGNAHGNVDVPGNFGTVARKDSPPIKPVELLPAPSLDKFPSLIRYLPTVVPLDSLAQARSYRVQVAADQDFLEIRLDRVVKGRFMLDQQFEDAAYYVRVRGVDANGLEGKNATKAFRVEARPVAPMARQPLSDQVLHTGAVSFSWAEVEAADQYLFELASDEGFQDVLERRQLDDIETRVNIAKPGTYFYRLSSITAEGRQGPPGKVVRIRVLPVPATPQPKPPAVEDDKLRLSWQEVEGVAVYQVQLASDAEFQNLVVDVRTAEPEVQVPRPPSGYYYFRLRSIDVEGYEGAFSTPQRFEVEPASYLPLILFTAVSILLLL
ncbi:FecR domain-containing protein [Thiolapillus sp.]